MPVLLVNADNGDTTSTIIFLDPDHESDSFLFGIRNIKCHTKGRI